MYHHIRVTTACLLALPLTWIAGCSAQTPLVKPTAQAGQQGGESGFTVAREGKAMSTIVLPDKALPVEIYAAEELTKHLELSTGAKLPTVREGELKTPAQSPIYVGNVRALRQIEVAPKVEAWGDWATVPAANVTAVAPDTSGIVKLPDGGEMYSGSNIAPEGGVADDAVMLLIDLGQAQDVGALAVVNRHDIPTNYNIRRVKVESSAKDDGQTWNETLFEGEPTPNVNEANAVRAIPLKAVKRRYFRVSVLANFWGTLDTRENSNTQLLSWKEWRVAALNPSAVVPASFQRLDSLEPNSFVVRTDGDALFLAGRDDAGNPLQDNVNVGTLFAVYEWLGQQASVRWLWPGEVGTYVPKKSTLLAGTWNLRSKPSLIHARLRFGPNFGTFKAASPAVGERYMRETSAWVRRHRFGRGASFEYGHAFENYWDRFGKEHPEYFALRPDGRRGPAEDTPHGHTLVQMCVSNPALHRQIIADWLEQRKNNPSLPWVNGAENDQDALNPACTCEVCRSWDEPGSKTLADRYARFWLALQAEAQKHDPNATVLGYAYAGYTDPPVKAKLNNRIIVGVVPAYEFPLEQDQKQAFNKLWTGWAATGAQLYLRPNYFLDGYDMPYIFAEEFGEEFKFAWKNNMIATDFDSLTGMWGVQSPNLYLLGRIHERPDMEVAEILNEFYSAFGPASGEVRAYFDYWKTISDRKNADFNRRSQGGWSKLSWSGDEIYTPDTFVAGKALLQKAERAAAGDAGALARVQFLSVWLEHARLSMVTLAAFHALQKDEANAQLKAAFKSSWDELDRFRAAHQDNELAAANIAMLKQVEAWSGWRPRPA